LFGKFLSPVEIFDRWKRAHKQAQKHKKKNTRERRKFFLRRIMEGIWQLFTITPSPSGFHINRESTTRQKTRRYSGRKLSGLSIFHTPNRGETCLCFYCFLLLLFCPPPFRPLSWTTLGCGIQGIGTRGDDHLSFLFFFWKFVSFWFGFPRQRSSESDDTTTQWEESNSKKLGSIAAATQVFYYQTGTPPTITPLSFFCQAHTHIHGG
jgi:hypothetical protein